MPAKKDFTQVALDVVRRATGDIATPAQPSSPVPARSKAAPPARKGAAKKPATKRP